MVYTFEEGADTLMNRCGDINIPVRSMVERGVLSLMQTESRYTPDEFAHLVRRDVEEQERRIVMIDSVMGYSLSLHGRDYTTHLHGLAMYLKSVGVTLVLINEVEAITGDFQATDGKVSYLSDNIIFLRYLELNGQLRKAIGVLKKRAGDFEAGFDERIWERCDRLRRRGIPFLVISPRPSPAMQRAGLSRGAKGVLVKPLSAKALLNLVHLLVKS